MNILKEVLKGLIVGTGVAFSVLGIAHAFQEQPDLAAIAVFPSLIALQLLALFKINKV